MQNRALNGMRSCKTDIAMAVTNKTQIHRIGYPWHRIAEDLRGGKGKKMKEGYSKSKPAPAAGFSPASIAGFNQAPAGGINSALDTGSSQVHESLSTPAPIRIRAAPVMQAGNSTDRRRKRGISSPVSTASRGRSAGLRRCWKRMPTVRMS